MAFPIIFGPLQGAPGLKDLFRGTGTIGYPSYKYTCRTHISSQTCRGRYGGQISVRASQPIPLLKPDLNRHDEGNAHNGDLQAPTVGRLVVERAGVDEQDETGDRSTAPASLMRGIPSLLV